jgi:hypothetical protein
MMIGLKTSHQVREGRKAGLKERAHYQATASANWVILVMSHSPKSGVVGQRSCRSSLTSWLLSSR